MKGQPERESNERIKRLNIAKNSIADRLNLKQRHEEMEQHYTVSEDESIGNIKEETKV